MKSCFYFSLKKTENQVFCSIFLIFFKKQSPYLDPVHKFIWLQFLFQLSIQAVRDLIC